MPNVFTQTRSVDGKTQYLCPHCNCWVEGKTFNGTGFPETICGDCGMTLQSMTTAEMQAYEGSVRDAEDPLWIGPGVKEK